jgi:cytochrome c-type biogenesis protein CcmH
VTGFFLAAAAMLVAALALILLPLLRRHPDAAADRVVTAPATITGVITAIVVPIVAVGLYLGITSYPWRGGGPPVATRSTHPASIEEAIAKIEAQLATHPDDATGWRMLGRSRVMTGQYAQAVTAYDKAIELTGGLDPGLRLDLAEALVLTNDAAGQARARQLVDEVLKSDPANQKALWYSGVIALRNDDAATAKQRFRALLAQEPPGEIRGILETQLAALEGVTPAQGSGDGAAVSAASATRGRTIRVAVSIDEGLASRLKTVVPVFVSARQPGIPGPPLAAVRLTSEALPATVELSDANAMIEGRNLSSVDEVEVSARVAFGGTATTAPGDLVGSARSRRSSQEEVAITIDREVTAP